MSYLNAVGIYGLVFFVVIFIAGTIENAFRRSRTQPKSHSRVVRHS